MGWVKAVAQEEQIRRPQNFTVRSDGTWQAVASSMAGSFVASSDLSSVAVRAVPSSQWNFFEFYIYLFM